MKLLLAMVRYELKLQLRSLRFRLAAVGYVVISAVPSALLYFGIRHTAGEELAGATYLAHTLQVQPYLTAILVVLVAGNRSSAGSLAEAWSVLAASPMSNGGFVARRWLALLALLVPLSAVPQVTALAAAVAAGGEVFDPVTWIGSWGLEILPLVVALTAYWLAWVTIIGGELGALIASFVAFPLVVSVANQGLLRLNLTLSRYLDWFGHRDFFQWIWWTLASSSRDRNFFGPSYAATEAPYDPAAAAAWLLPRGALLVGTAALGLGLSVAFVRRTRRDLPPRPVPPDHPLRTFLGKLNRQRERSAPDGALALPERLMMIAGVVGLGLAAGGWLERQREVHRLAAERYRAETEHAYAPLPATVHTASWRLDGRIDPRGHVDVDLEARFENRGAAPQTTLAFSLNPGLAIEEVAAPSKRVEAVRAWDRLLLRLEPPLAAGEALDLEARVAGVPRRVTFDFGRASGGGPFAVRYPRWLNARFPRDVTDLSRSWIRPAASPRRIRLEAQDLGPVPRYTPWTLTRRGESAGEDLEESDYGREVPRESSRIVVDLELALDAPGPWLLADSCGRVSSRVAARSRLVSACTTSLRDLVIAGGEMVKLTGGGAPGDQVTFAALPAHRESAARQLESLARVAALSDRAWPGLPGLEGLAAVEWPPEFDVDLRHGMNTWRNRDPELVGRLLLIPERRLIDVEPLEPDDLVAQLLVRDLLERRAVVAEQEVLFRQMFRALMIRRMGLDDGRGATVSGRPWLRQALATPILSARPGFGTVWRRRLPAVMVEVESRIGAESLYAGIESFLSTGGEPGSVEELLDELESRSGVSLERIYQDHFVGTALPLLRLEDVRSARRDDGWLVTGEVRNTGTGQSICPVIVKTEVTELKLTVTVDSESATAFSARSASRPHTVLLDPERTCYRFLLKTSPALERANLLG